MSDAFLWIFAGILVLVAIVIYVLLMIFSPEWVGITGRKALENQASHREQTEPTDSPNTEI